MKKGFLESTFDSLSTGLTYLILAMLWFASIYGLVKFDYGQAQAIWPVLAACALVAASLPAGLLYMVLGGKHSESKSVF